MGESQASLITGREKGGKPNFTDYRRGKGGKPSLTDYRREKGGKPNLKAEAQSNPASKPMFPNFCWLSESGLFL